MNYRSIADLAASVRANLSNISRDVDAIAGVPRSGLLVANMIALGLNRPLTDIDGLCEGRQFIPGKTRMSSMSGWKSGPEEWKTILVVDDSVASGRTMQRIKEQISSARLPYRIIYCAAYVTHECRNDVDIFFEDLRMPRMFEWNLMHHPMLKACCVDFDGVLCRDPTSLENDDGDRYRRFLLESPPLFLPTQKIGWIVTSRLEKYRTQSVEWLERNGVSYDHLVMLDLPDGRTRRRLGIHASFKAEIYRNCAAELFIESDSRQSSEIARISGKPALCVENQRLSSSSIISYSGIEYRSCLLVKRVAKKMRRIVNDLINKYIL